MRYSIHLLALFAFFLSGSAYAAPIPSTTDTQDVIWFADGTPTGGKSHLTRTDGMVLATVEAVNLKPGNVFTLWWIVFNMPDNCFANCGGGDIFNEDGSLNTDQVAAVGIAVGNATGNTVKADGTLEFGAQLPMGSNTPGHQVLFGSGLGPVMLVSSPHDAEVHLIIQSHGQGRGGPPLLNQLSMIETNCTPQCADLQAAVHLP